MVTTVSKTELARRTREVVELAKRHSAVLVKSFGQEEVAVLDALDYRLLRAAALCGSTPSSAGPPAGLSDEEVEQALQESGGDVQVVWNLVISSLMRADISLGRSAALLGMSRLELAHRINRLGLRLPPAPSTADDVRAEIEALRD